MEQKFAKVNADLGKIDLKAFEQGGEHFFTSEDAQANPADVLQKLCRIYHVVKPALNVVLHIPLIPGRVKDAIRTFMGLMDSVCG